MKVLVTGGSGFIGTNAVNLLSRDGNTILNYSLHAPLDSAQIQYWRAGDILDSAAIAKAFREFQPHWVLHLAARAECDETTTVEAGYRVNTVGTQNVLDAIRATPSVQRTIVTSSQFVCAPGRLPKNDTDYFPETVYGESKVITEKLTREANLPCCWTIIRPTNIWGPWHLRYRREFWRAVQRGLYVHPGRPPVIRCYGYVKNVVYQIQKILAARREIVHGQTLYLGDRPVNLRDWVNGFSRALTGHDVRIVPRPLIRALALLGDIPTYLTGEPFLINSSRLHSMITDYETPMERTFDLFGENPYTLEEGIRETVEWLESHRNLEHSPSGGF
ncbi:MAG TPA: NAD(P)-dependent oxidoreductase [Chthoniobacterales bacterium]|nr:NAD(P)-dependent oxidoreductase [Chthoniobacterales bacterium]